MSRQEQGSIPNAAVPLSIMKLEKGETLVAFCNTCMRVVCKGSKTRISQMVMFNQIEDHIEAFEEDHDVEILPANLHF